MIGLRDAAALLHSERARAAVPRAASAPRAARSPTFDTGAWSLYSEHGAESTLNYHSLIAGFLGGLCDRVRKRSVLPRRRALRALRARADADRHHAAAASVRADRAEHGALHALEDLDREGARVGHARDEPLARPRGSPRGTPRVGLAPARAAAATGCGSRPAGRAGPLGVETAHDPDHAAQAEAQEEGAHQAEEGSTARADRLRPQATADVATSADEARTQFASRTCGDVRDFRRRWPPPRPTARRRPARRQREPRPLPDRDGHRAPDPRPRRRRLAGVVGAAGLERPDRVRDHVRRDRPGHHGRLPPAVHAPLVQDRQGRARDPRRARLGGDRGAGHLLGRRPPQAPRVLRPGRAIRTRRTSTTGTGSRARCAACCTRTSAGCSSTPSAG